MRRRFQMLMLTAAICGVSSPSFVFAEPSICARGDASSSDTWDRARSPTLARYCDRLAQSEACLRDDPSRAAGAAALAEKEMPGRAEPLLLRATALEAMGSSKSAIPLFDQAHELDPSAPLAAPTLYALARARADVGDEAGARTAFRALLPKLSGLPGSETRAFAAVDAALSILREGPDSANDAIAILRGALDDAPPPARSLVQAALSLALDRHGSRAEAAALAKDARESGGAAWFSPMQKTKRLPGSSIDKAAMSAELADGPHGADAIASWEAVGRVGGAWSAHAKSRANELRHSPTASSRGKGSSK